MTIIERETRETKIRVELTPGDGDSVVTTDSRFLSHMLITLARYGGFRLHVDATGDLRKNLPVSASPHKATSLALIIACCPRHRMRVQPGCSKVSLMN